MASQYLHGPEDPDDPLFTPPVNTGTPTLTLTPLHIQTAQASPITSQLPSPSGMSAAAILTALSESRPPASQEDDVEEVEDEQEQDGGITLMEEGYDIHTFAIPTMTAPSLLDVDGDVTPTSEDLNAAQFAGGHIPFPLHDLEEIQNAVMSIEPPFFGEPSAPWSQLLSTSGLASGAFHDFDVGFFYPSDDSLYGLQNKDAFLDITTFFRHCVQHPKDATTICLDVKPPPEVITRDDLRGDECDYQGIDWALRHTTRDTIRKKRAHWESARIASKMKLARDVCAFDRRSSPGAAEMQERPGSDRRANFFSFKRMNTAHKATIPHFQLRNLLASTSRNDIYYATIDRVLRTDSNGSPATTIMDLSKEKSEGLNFAITTLAASDDVLIAGGFEGEYALTNLSSTYGTRTTIGRITDRSQNAASHITNHMHIFNSRHNYTPQAALCSNDNHLRILDCTTNTITHSFPYTKAVNCSATSPNGRMRVVVGDFHETLITNAETGQPFETMHTHTDDVFACAWADDGIHVATAAQDSRIVVWDARFWARPLADMHSELSIPRSLRFSPVGGGPRVLAIAEADDYLSIVDAVSFERKQVFDFFGRTAGICFSPDGDSLFLANQEHRFGGIMEFERCGWGERRHSSAWDEEYESVGPDWLHDEDMGGNFRIPTGEIERGRRGVGLGEFVV